MAKGILKDQKDIHMTVRGFLGSSSQKKKNTIEFANQKRKFKGKRKKKKNKGQNKCFLCGLKCHWNKEYPKFLKRQSSMHHYLLAESCLVLDSTNSWWTDSKATTHVCNSLQGFQLRRRLNDQDMYLTLAFEARVVVQVVEDVIFIFFIVVFQY